MSLPTLRQLEYLVAVIDEGSFRAAAKACGVTQPGLSQQIQQLEEAVGVCLLERDRRRVRVTAAGEAVVERARALLVGAGELVQAAQGVARPLSGKLRLGVIPTIAPYWLPAVLPHVRRKYKDLELLLREDRTAALVAALEGGCLDLLLLALEAPLGRAVTLPLFTDPFVLAAPFAHPLAGRARIRQSDLAGEQVLLLEEGHCLRDQALDVCDQQGASEWGDFRAGSLSTLTQMVAGGAGITLIPAMSIPVEAERVDGLVVRPFRRPAPKRTIGLAWRPSSPRAAEFQLLAETLRAGRKRPDARTS